MKEVLMIPVEGRPWRKSLPESWIREVLKCRVYRDFTGTSNWGHEVRSFKRCSAVGAEPVLYAECELLEEEG